MYFLSLETLISTYLTIITSFRVRGHSPLKTDEGLKFTAGDVVGCGVEAQFQGDGEITQDSEVQVYFTKNGQKVTPVLYTLKMF